MKDVADNIELIIADFQREYQINLLDEAYTLSSDRFFILVGGLSSNSVFMNVMAQEKKPVKRERKDSEYDFIVGSPEHLAMIRERKLERESKSFSK